MVIRNFFQVSPNNPLDGQVLNQAGSSSTSQVYIGRELNTLDKQQNVKRKRQTISKKIRNSAVVQA